MRKFVELSRFKRSKRRFTGRFTISGSQVLRGVAHQLVLARCSCATMNPVVIPFSDRVSLFYEWTGYRWPEKSPERSPASKIHNESERRGAEASERADYVLAKLSKDRSTFRQEALAAAPAFRPMEYALQPDSGDAYLQLQAFSLGLYAISSSILIALREFSTANSPTSALQRCQPRSLCLSASVCFFRWRIFG